jgi:hypothetical protein
MSTVLATGADARYGYHLVNLLGSLRANSDVFDEIVAFDLGLTPHQRRLLEDVPAVAVRTVPEFVPHWREGRTWKTWIWTHVDAERLFWLDAGLTLLRPLDDALAQIDARDYFAVSQGHPVRDSIPTDYYEHYGFPRELANRDSIAAGIIGFRVGSEFYERVIVPTFDDAVRGLSIGFSPSEVVGLNAGLDANAEPTIRDCAHFRWDQTILNLRFYLGVADPLVADVDEYAGWRSPRDHPQQVIWSHRRVGNMAYLWRAPASPRNRLFGLLYRVRWWRKLNQKWFRRSTYELKARKTLAALLRSPR